MTTLSSFNKTDLVDDHTAADVNDLIASTMRSEFKNVETLSGTRALLDADTPIQRLDCGGTGRIVTMPAEDAVNNHPFWIINSSDAAETITVKNAAGSTTLGTILQGGANYYLPDGNGSYKAIRSEAWPVGSVFISVVSTSPATLLGYGTWAAFGTGKVLVGIDAGDADFDTVEETGGAKTVAGGAHTHSLSDDGWADIVIGNSAIYQKQATVTTWTADYQASVTRGSSTTDLSAAPILGGATDSGTPAASSVVQPYIVVYMWKRTA